LTQGRYIEEANKAMGGEKPAEADGEGGLSRGTYNGAGPIRLKEKHEKVMVEKTIPYQGQKEMTRQQKERVEESKRTPFFLTSDKFAEKKRKQRTRKKTGQSVRRLSEISRRDGPSK